MFNLRSRFLDFFDDFWVRLVDAAVEEVPCAPNVQSEIRTHVEELLTYNLQDGKLLRGLGVLEVAQRIRKLQDRPFTSDDFDKAAALGWAVEVLQAAFLVADDVMDHSPVRRGKPSWHCKQGVGLAAVNDAFLLESLAFKAVDIYFDNDPLHSQITRTIRYVARVTEWGQFLDTIGTQIPPETMDIGLLHAITVYKTSYYTFFLPFCLGLFATGFSLDTTLKSHIEALTMVLGKLFQIQDDYLDVFGEEKVVGKTSTDLVERKCAWPLVCALDIVQKSENKRELFPKLLGLINDKDVDKLRNFIHDVGVEKEYLIVQKELRDDLDQKCQDCVDNDSLVLKAVALVCKDFAVYLSNRVK
ncbi:hypothetical protein P9112_000269 [Eukaryota sp. TZLM1-RC]